MTLWDGLKSNGQIMVLGATNRKMTLMKHFGEECQNFAIGKPNASQRTAILNKILKDAKLDENDFDLEYIVANTRGFSGSDLRELCREAAICL